MTTPLFSSWLASQRYAEQSIRATVRFTHRLERLRKAELHPDASWKTHLARIVAGAEAGCPDLSPEIADAARSALATLDAGHKKLRGGRRPKGRTLPARAVPDAEWATLRAELAKPRADPDEEGTAAVLYLQASTGMRVGDVLRLPRGEVARAMETGTIHGTQKGGGGRVRYVQGAPGAWARLAAVCAARHGENVAEALTGSADPSSDGAAYKRAQRLLYVLRAELGVSDRLHTHRLRRTVGVQALRLTEDVPAVGELLGHAPGSRATLSYLDEARPERVAELTKQIGRTFGGG